MILIEYGEHKELFMTDTWCVPEAAPESGRPSLCFEMSPGTGADLRA